MRKPCRTVAVACAFAAAALAASTIYGDSSREKDAPTMREGGGHMGEMRGMMKGCARMMGMSGWPLGEAQRPMAQTRAKRAREEELMVHAERGASRCRRPPRRRIIPEALHECDKSMR
jgi:hypothetical protein